MTSSKFKLKSHTSELVTPATGIYQIRNLINGKLYIGSAVNINSRWRTHKANLKLNKHKSKHLQASWNKYGVDNFVFEILEYCDKEKLIEREQYWVNKYNLKFLYNKRKEVSSNFGWRGWKQNLDWIEKRMAHRRGKKINDPQILKNMSECQKGKKLSEETKIKISNKLKNKAWLQNEIITVML